MNSEPLRGERRPVTVLFADLSGFTAFADAHDPEEVCRILNHCFDCLVQIVHRYGGVVDKFIGDEVMALFGAPQAHEDDPQRALRAGLEMQALMQQDAVLRAADWGLHIGVNTGLVIAADIGAPAQQSYTVIGGVVNLAARLKEAAGRGQVLVGPDTFRLSAALFNFAPLPPLSLKGKSEPVNAWRLLGLRSRPGTGRGLAGGVRSGSLVGRTAELAALRTVSTAVLNGGRGQAILVLGEPGLGKSRLVQEWQQQVLREDGSFLRLRWIEGNGISYGQGQPYSLLTSFLRSLLGVGEEASAEELHATLVRAGQGLPAVHVPYLLHLLGLELTAAQRQTLAELEPQALQAQYVTALRQLLLSMAQRTPLLLVLEDVHWADPSSAALLSKLLSLVQEAPILWCLVGRPDGEAPGWQLVEAARQLSGGGCLEVRLQALSEVESRQLVKNLFASALPEPLLVRLLQRTEGNPFFMEEVLRMWMEDGLLMQQPDGSWVSIQAEDAAAIPDSLQALLLARFDRIPAAERRTLQVAAVIGRGVERALLQQAAGLTAAEGEMQLARLQQAGLLEGVEGLRFQFRHSLLQEAIQQSLLREDRRSLHCRVAQALEQLPGAAPEQLAHHWEACGQKARALHYARLAGRAAFQRFAIREAIACNEQARRLAHGTAAFSLADWQALCLVLGRCYELDARYREALETYAWLETQALEQKNPQAELAAVVEIARLRCMPGPEHDAVHGRAAAERGLSLARRLDDLAAEARLNWVLLILSVWEDRPEAGVDYGERALQLARRLGLRELTAYTLQDIHRAYRAVGRNAEGNQALEEARRLWRELDNLPMLADNLNSSADAAMMEGDPVRALALGQEAAALSLSIGNLWNQAFGTAVQADAWSILGVVDASRQAAQHSNHLAAQAGLLVLRRRTSSNQVMLALRLGDFKTAQAILQQMIAAEQTDPLLRQPIYRFVNRQLAAVAAAFAGDLWRTEALMAEVRALLPLIPSGNQAHVVQLHILVRLLRGSFEQALDGASVSPDLERSFNQNWKGWMIGMTGVVQEQMQQWAAAWASYQAALDIFEPMGNRNLLWKLNAALARLAHPTGRTEQAAEYAARANALVLEVAATMADAQQVAAFQAYADPILRAEAPLGPPFCFL